MPYVHHKLLVSGRLHCCRATMLRVQNRQKRVKGPFVSALYAVHLMRRKGFHTGSPLCAQVLQESGALRGLLAAMETPGGLLISGLGCGQRGGLLTDAELASPGCRLAAQVMRV